MTVHQDHVHCWIKAKDDLPNVCCSCGMFTDHRVKIKHQGFVPTKGVGAGETIILIVLHLFLGPIGWLIGMAAGQGKEGETKHVKKTFKVPVSQCQLCSGIGAPEVIDSRPDLGEYLVMVHREFDRRLEQERLEVKQAKNNTSPW